MNQALYAHMNNKRKMKKKKEKKSMRPQQWLLKISVNLSSFSKGSNIPGQDFWDWSCLWCSTFTKLSVSNPF
jgi:hypothetical protein